MDFTSKDSLDRWLDSAFRQYGNAEPRPGLEQRVLANVNRQQEQIAPRWWWALAASGAVAAILLLWLAIAPQHPKHQSNVAQNLPQPALRELPPRRPSAGEIKRVPKPVKPIAVTARTQVAAAPHLSQFPSPRPLSAQEFEIANYVKQFPSEALLLAQEHEQFEKQIEEAQRGAINGAPPQE